MSNESKELAAKAKSFDSKKAVDLLLDNALYILMIVAVIYIQVFKNSNFLRPSSLINILSQMCIRDRGGGGHRQPPQDQGISPALPGLLIVGPAVEDVYKRQAFRYGPSPVGTLCSPPVRMPCPTWWCWTL